MLLALLVQQPGLAIAQDESGWPVRFFVNAKSDFDRWTERPSRELQRWMREHYDRMLTYSPYFDRRLEWYPDAWVYRDLYAIYPDSSVFRDHPEWVLRDPAGEMLYIPFGCSRGRCPQYAADIGNPDYRRSWIERVRATVERGYRGLWIDDVNVDWRVSNGRGEHVRPLDPRTGEPMVLSDWRRYFAEFTEEVRRALPDIEIAHNVIWYATPADDPFIERQLKAADYINLERGVSDDGIRGGSGKYGFETLLAFIDRVHALGSHMILEDDDSDTMQERDYELAAYFLIRRELDLVSADGDRARMNPDNFWKGYELDLGAPRGERYLSRDGVLQRDYQCGTVLLNQPHKPQRLVRLAAPHWTLDGEPVERVRLKSASGAVLLAADCAGSEQWRPDE